MLRSMETKVHWTTPYRSASNGRYESHVQELNKMVKVVCATFAPNEEDAEGDEDLVCMAVCLLNAQPRSLPNYKIQSY